MKTAATLLAVLATMVSSSWAQSVISYTTNAVAGGNNAFANIALNKFDTGLGTLTDVLVTVNFTTLGGSFSVSTPSDSETPADVEAATGRITIRGITNSLGFTQIGQTNFAVNTSPSLLYTVPAPSGSQIFTIVGTNVLVASSQNISTNFWSAYQSAGGIGSVVFQVRNNPDVTVSGGVFTLNALAFTANANMTVAYTYTPSAAVPEPGTWAAAALLLGGAAYTIRRRRQNNAATAAA